MFDANRIYGLDIETDNSEGFGLDPANSRITDVALATAFGGVALGDMDERDLLIELTENIDTLDPGLIVTWNGAFFDLPFIIDRAKALGLREVTDHLMLYPQPGLEPKYGYLPGHTTAYSALWNHHSHLDISLAWRKFAEDNGVKWSLKPVMRAAGFDPVEIDRTRLHEYPPAEVFAYVMSDADGARDLAMRTLGLS